MIILMLLMPMMMEAMVVLPCVRLVVGCLPRELQQAACKANPSSSIVIFIIPIIIWWLYQQTQRSYNFLWHWIIIVFIIVISLLHNQSDNHDTNATRRQLRISKNTIAQDQVVKLNFSLKDRWSKQSSSKRKQCVLLFFRKAFIPVSAAALSLNTLQWTMRRQCKMCKIPLFCFALPIYCSCFTPFHMCTIKHRVHFAPKSFLFQATCLRRA